MKTVMVTLALALTFAGNAIACGTAGEKCPHHATAQAAPAKGEHCAEKNDVASLSASDQKVAEQAAASMLSIDNDRDEGKMSADLRKSIASGSSDLAAAAKKQKVTTACCKSEGADCCKGAGEACCGSKHKNAVAANAFDGATKTMTSECPEHKN